MSNIVVVKGAGDLASGTIYKLHKSGFSVVALEIDEPTAIRRAACFSEAVYEKVAKVEDLEAVLCRDIEDIGNVLDQSKVAIIVDPSGEVILNLKPMAVVDAIIAKRNTGLKIDIAPIVIAIGPGFSAGLDCHAVIESSRGHNLGRVIYEGGAKENTGIPGIVSGFTTERILRAPTSGFINTKFKIGDIVNKNDIVAKVDDQDLHFEMDGLIRGLIRNNTYVYENMKIGDIDPRIDEIQNCYTISDKARCIAGGVLEAILTLKNNL